MTDSLLTVDLANLEIRPLDLPETITREFRSGRGIKAWLWLAADTDDVEEKWRCLQAVLELNPEHQSARALSALLFQREVKRIERESIADDRRHC